MVRLLSYFPKHLFRKASLMWWSKSTTFSFHVFFAMLFYFKTYGLKWGHNCFFFHFLLLMVSLKNCHKMLLYFFWFFYITFVIHSFLNKKNVAKLNIFQANIALDSGPRFFLLFPTRISIFFILSLDTYVTRQEILQLDFFIPLNFYWFLAQKLKKIHFAPLAFPNFCYLSLDTQTIVVKADFIWILAQKFKWNQLFLLIGCGKKAWNFQSWFHSNIQPSQFWHLCNFSALFWWSVSIEKCFNFCGYIAILLSKTLVSTTFSFYFATYDL